jgi:hypothetical protein
MSRIFVGIGGTGKETLLSYLNLALLCGYMPVKAYIFDSDLTDSTGTVGDSIAGFIKNNHGWGLNIDRTNIDAKPAKLNANKSVFREAFRMDPADAILLEAFFEPRQREIDFATGFYGQPMVGSVCMKQTIGELKNDPTFKTFLSDVTRDADNVAVLVGSNFGGTGAGGTPIVGETIHKYQADHGGLDRLFLGFVSHYKWFSLINVPPNSPIREADLIRNTQSGLRYYGDKLCRIFDKIIMLGLPEDVTREGSNAQQQKDQKDLLYPISALLANSMFQVPFGTLKQANLDSKPNKFRFEDLSSLSLASIRGSVPSSERKRLNLESFWRDVDFRDSVEGNITTSYYLSNLCFWLSDYIDSPYSRDRVWIENHFPRGFDRIIRAVDRRELKANFLKLAENLAASLEWFDGFCRNVNNGTNFIFKRIPKLAVEKRSMADIAIHIEPEFKEAFGLDFQGLFMEDLKKPFSHGNKGSEKQFSLEVYQRLRAVVCEKLR